MKRYAFVVIICSMAMGLAAAVHATPHTELELNVSPLQCVMDTVATGSSFSTQLTPDECRTTSLSPEPELAAVNQPADRPADVVVPQTIIADADTQLAAESKNTVSPVGQIAQIGTLITENPIYASMGMMVLVPLSLLATKVFSGGGLRRVASWLIGRLPF